MSENAPVPEADTTAGIDTRVPQSARFWNYLLGGKDNFAVDREVGDQVIANFPRLVAVARESRAFLGRAVRHLVEEAGLRQFLDIGTGLPTAENTHEIAQRYAPDSRVVYVDNDPLVLAYARALLTSTRKGSTSYLGADVREPEDLLRRAEAKLDMTRPVGLVLMGIMGHVADFDEVLDITRRLVSALPPGSAFVYYDGTNTHEQMVRANHQYTDSGAVPYQVRTPEQIRSVFHDLDLVEPGVVPVTRWRPDTADPDPDIDGYGGVGLLPCAQQHP